MIGIYQIKIGEKIYIGSSTNIVARRYTHLNKLKHGTHANPHLQNAYNKYGTEALTFTILETIENADELVALEQKYIDELKPEYNIRVFAENNFGIKTGPCPEEKKRKLSLANTGYKHSEEALRKMSDAQKGIKNTDEQNRKISQSLMGHLTSGETREKLRIANTGKIRTEEMNAKMRERIVTEEAKLKMSLAHQGVKTGPMSEERKRKLSIANKGRVYEPLTAEQRQRQSEAQKGRVFSEESRQKISQAIIGRPVSDETKSKMREAKLGRAMSDETKQKIRESQLKFRSTQ